MTDAAHPLTVALAEALVRMVTPRVLLLGVGSGRNLPALLATGAQVDALDDDAERTARIGERFGAPPGLRVARHDYTDPLPFRERYDAAISTHALLHGTAASVRLALKNVRQALRVSAPLHIVLGSRQDPRYGQGLALGDGVFILDEGSEAGVPHVFFDERGVHELLGAFEVEALEEVPAAETAGRWAHAPEEAEHLVHWFVRARKPAA